MACMDPKGTLYGKSCKILGSPGVCWVKPHLGVSKLGDPQVIVMTWIKKGLAPWLRKPPLGAIPTVTLFCHSSFWWHIFSDILFWYSIWHPFWHPIWHPFWHLFWHLILWHSIWHLSDNLFGIYSDILSGISSDILSGILSGISLEILCGWGLAGNTLILSLLFGSGGEHCDLALAVGGGGGTADIKSNNPHLTGREKHRPYDCDDDPRMTWCLGQPTNQISWLVISAFYLCQWRLCWENTNSDCKREFLVFHPSDSMPR